MSQSKIPLFKPLIEQDELDAARQALELGWLGMGSYVGQFERELGAFLDAGSRQVLAVSTGHAALHIALLLAGVGLGDEVITPAFNNAADFQAILATGAHPVFCDIEDGSLCIDVDSAKRLVSKRTKAVIAMDYGCRLCNHDRVAEFARSEGLRVVHDAAHAFGSRYKGRMLGSFSDLAMFSFDPVKAITCIDGGALVVQSEAEADQAHELRFLGMSQSSKALYGNTRAWSYDIASIGFRYHMANVHAAIGLAQLGKMASISASRRDAARHYNRHLGEIGGVRVPDTDFNDITPMLYFVRVPASRRADLRRHLDALGIETGVHWRPGHEFALFRDCRRGELPVTGRVAEEVLSLPLHSGMSQTTLERVIDGVKAFFARP